MLNPTFKGNPPYFNGKNPWFPVDCPLNQTNDLETTSMLRFEHTDVEHTLSPNTPTERNAFMDPLQVARRMLCGSVVSF